MSCKSTIPWDKILANPSDYYSPQIASFVAHPRTIKDPRIFALYNDLLSLQNASTPLRFHDVPVIEVAATTATVPNQSGVVHESQAPSPPHSSSANMSQAQPPSPQAHPLSNTNTNANTTPSPTVETNKSNLLHSHPPSPLSTPPSSPSHTASPVGDVAAAVNVIIGDSEKPGRKKKGGKTGGRAPHASKDLELPVVTAPRATRSSKRKAPEDEPKEGPSSAPAAKKVKKHKGNWKYVHLYCCVRDSLSLTLFLFVCHRGSVLIDDDSNELSPSKYY